MLGKLAYRNTKRNIKDYLIYLITVTTSFSLIFAFNLVASSDEIVKLCSSMDAFKNSLFAVNILITFVICFLINYTTKFMFEKRSKELGTYMLLGIKKKEIAHLVIIENILLGILAFVLAIPIGFLFSQFVSLVIVNLLGIPKTLFISLNFVSIGLLIIYFLTIYVLVLLNLLRRISKMTIRDFLYFDKQNEKKMFRDSKKRNVIFVLSIILGAISLFLWNSRCTMDNFNKQETLTYLMVSVIMLIISIYGISTTCADMFLTVLLKNKKMKYQNDNLFVARTFASKARTMSFTFGTLSMLILISLLALNYSSINKASYDISVNLNAPYDVQLFDDKQVFDEYIRVDHQLIYKNLGDGCKFHISTPKTSSGIRIIPMTQEVAKAFEEQRKINFMLAKDKSIEVDGCSGFVFTAKSGRPLMPNGVNSVLYNIVDASQRSGTIRR